MLNKLTNKPIAHSKYLCRGGFVQALSKPNRAIALTFFALILTTGCATQKPTVIAPAGEAPVATPATPAATPQANLPTGSAPAAPTPAALPNAELVGENVTVSTKVQKVIAPNIFTVYDKESLRGQEVLVVSKDPAPAVGTNIELTGIVRAFNVVEIERDYSLDLTPEIETQYASKPYIAAKAIEKVD
ncbi:MAG TPA: hypothetical protein DDW76_26095 [Cyanobacteria bacterium UBA11369]|nr:hypothetical protein [Cyanobacteria bacterium UBA11371]HBE32196.1 hypothetical protein [Cyanobacteria bacterium UBA11368]HBE52147.1 hypothetical protein [Cyanobacteria bacterium UBA11369]